MDAPTFSFFLVLVLVLVLGGGGGGPQALTKAPRRNVRASSTPQESQPLCELMRNAPTFLACIPKRR